MMPRSLLAATIIVVWQLRPTEAQRGRALNLKFT